MLHQTLIFLFIHPYIQTFIHSFIYSFFHSHRIRITSRIDSIWAFAGNLFVIFRFFFRHNWIFQPVFKLVQKKKGSSKCRISLVLDVSGSMKGERLQKMLQGLQKLILYTLPEDTYVGTTKFGGKASVRTVRNHIIKSIGPSSKVKPLPFLNEARHTHTSTHNCSILNAHFKTFPLEHHWWTDGQTDGQIDSGQTDG